MRAQSPGRWRALRAALPEWWPVLLGLAVLFVPTFYDLFTGAWVGEEQGHGPIIFGLALWLIYRKWPEMLAATTPPRSSWAGWPILASACCPHAGPLAEDPDAGSPVDHPGDDGDAAGQARRPRPARAVVSVLLHDLHGAAAQRIRGRGDDADEDGGVLGHRAHPVRASATRSAAPA
jgi:hypothetical protein